MRRAPVRSVHDMEIDEVSLVDRPANQFASLVIAKRAGGADVAEETEPDEIYTLDGQRVTDLNELTDGQRVVDADGNQFTYVLESDGDDGDAHDDDESESPFLAGAGAQTVGKSLADTFRAELAKAQTGGDVSQLVAKMETTLALADQRVAQAEQQAAGAAELAKGERHLRLTREYVAKAGEYNVPVDPTVLGPVLMRMEEAMPYEDCVVIDTILKAAGSMLYTEIGYRGGAGPEDPLAAALAGNADAIAKGDLHPGDALEEFYEHNPSAYADYLAGR